MKQLLKNSKSNKGFTMQDLIIAIAIIVIFAGTISGSYIAIYKIQAQTRMTSAATLYAVQILENIDKISYDQVTTGMEESYRSTYNIPDNMNLSLQVTNNSNGNGKVKNITLTISYKLLDSTETIVFERIKVKES